MIGCFVLSVDGLISTYKVREITNPTNKPSEIKAYGQGIVSLGSEKQDHKEIPNEYHSSNKTGA